MVFRARPIPPIPARSRVRRHGTSGAPQGGNGGRRGGELPVLRHKYPGKAFFQEGFWCCEGRFWRGNTYNSPRSRPWAWAMVSLGTLVMKMPPITPPTASATLGAQKRAPEPRARPSGQSDRTAYRPASAQARAAREHGEPRARAIERHGWNRGKTPATPAGKPIQNTKRAARVADHYHSASEHGIIGRRIDTVVADRWPVGGALAGHGSHEVRVEEGDAAWRR